MGVWLRNGAIALAVAVVGAKLYADYRFDQQLERLAGRISLFGTLTTADSYAGFDGTLGIRSLSFIPDPGLDAPPLTIREVKLKTPGFLWILGLGRSALPNTMGIELNGIEAELAGLVGDESRSSISGLPVETLGCTGISRFEQVDLHNMGFSEQSSNLNGRYRIFPPDQLELQLMVENAGAAQVMMEYDLTIKNMLSLTRGQTPAEASLNRLSLSLQASEFNRRRNSYCASHSDLDTEQFVDIHVEQVEQELADARLEPSPELRYQYQRFARGDGTWSIQAEPDSPVSMAELASMDPARMMQRLNISGAIASGVPEQLALLELVVEEPGEVVEVDPSGQEVVRLTGPLRWKEIEVSTLASYIGRDVRIDARSGEEYTGRLKSVDNGRVLISTIFPGGTAEIPIPTSQIFRARLATRD